MQESGPGQWAAQAKEPSLPPPHLAAKYKQFADDLARHAAQLASLVQQLDVKETLKELPRLRSSFVRSTSFGAFIGFFSGEREEHSVKEVPESIIERLLLRTKYKNGARADLGSVFLNRTVMLPQFLFGQFVEPQLRGRHMPPSFRWLAGYPNYITHHGVEIALSAPSVFIDSYFFEQHLGSVADLSRASSMGGNARAMFRALPYRLCVFIPHNDPGFFTPMNAEWLAKFIVQGLANQRYSEIRFESLAQALDTGKVDVVARLRGVLAGLEDLVKNFDGRKEQEFHVYLQENKEIFGFQIRKLLSKKPLQNRVTDFVAIYGDGNIRFIEIEKPSSKLFRQDGRFHSEFNNAYEQVEEFLSIAGRNRDMVRATISEDIDKYDGMLVIGLRCGLEYAQRIKLEDKRKSSGSIDVQTFDDLVENFRQAIDSLARMQQI